MPVKWFRYLRTIGDALRAFGGARKLWAPRRARIAVLHAPHLPILVPLFGGQPYEVVYLDGEGLYLDPRILLSTLAKVIQTRKLKVGYAIAVLERIRPAIVVTFIDNSLAFQTAARYVPKARFLAIQNGTRLLARDHPPGAPTIYLREFACLGRFEIDQFAQHGAQVETYYPVGSLKDSYYRAERRVNGTGLSKQFDLCLVSQFSPAARFKYSERLDGFEVLTQHVRRFCEAHHTTICVALREPPDTERAVYEWERDFFETRLGKHAQLFPNDPVVFATYSLVDRSRVSLGAHTTVLREGFGRGNRVLSCNYTGQPVYDFPVPGPWSVTDPAYDVFEQRLLWLLRASDEEYLNVCGDTASYLIAYDDKMPTHVFLQRLIAEAVRGAAAPAPMYWRETGELHEPQPQISSEK